MNKNIVFAIISILLLSGVSLAIISSTDDGSIDRTDTQPTASTTQNSQQTAPNEQAEATTQPSSQAGTYAEYSEDKVATADGDTYLFFHAPWCPQCRSIESDINSQGVPEGVTILKVDYDSSQELRQKYGVTLQTTFVKLDENGNKVSNYVAYNEPTFDAVKRDFIN